MRGQVHYLAETIRRYRLDRFKEVRPWLTLLEQGRLSDSVAKALLMRFHPLIEKQERRPNLLFRAPEYDELYPDAPPELIMGHLEEDEDVPLGLFLKGAFHCLFVGTTGGGKSVAMRRLVAGVEELNRTREHPVVILILDYKDTTFLDFPGLFGDHWSCFDVLGPPLLGIQPPLDVPSSVWINHVATSFCARAGLIAAWVTMANQMRWLAAAMNPEPTDQLRFPDFQLLLDAANALPKKVFAEKTQYLDSYVQCLKGITQASGDLFRTFSGLDLERDLISQGRSAVFSVGNLSPPWLNQFVADLFVLQLLLGRMARKHRSNDPEVLLILDDCDAIVSKDNERKFLTGMPPTVQGLRFLRGSGVGIILGVGARGPVSEQVLNSMTHQFEFRNRDGDSVNAAIRTLGLPAGNQTLMQSLEAGECVALVPGPWSHAMLGRIDPVPVHETWTPRYDAGGYIEAQRLESMPEVHDAIEKMTIAHKKGENRRAQLEHGTLRHKARQLLIAAAEHPYWPVVQLYRLIETPSSEAQMAIRKELTDCGYATFVDVRVGRRNLALIELKDAAWSLMGKPPIDLRGRGDLPHRSYANWLALLGERQKFPAVVEWVIPGTRHPVDTAWNVGEGRWEVFEVVNTVTANLGHSLEAAFLTSESPVVRATVVAAQKRLLIKLESQIKSTRTLAPYMEQIAYLSVEDIVKELFG